MATIAIFGGTGYAGSAIREEALKRGHSVIAVSRSGPPADSAQDGPHVPGGPDVQYQQGDVHDDGLVEALADEADVIVVAIPGREINGRKLIDALGSLTTAAAKTGTRLGFVGGAGSLLVREGGPRVVDGPDFPEAHKNEALSHADVLAALRETSDDVDWFYLSPAAGFGSYAPGEPTGAYRVGGDVLVTDANGTSFISGADYALAFVDEIEQARHGRERFTVAY
jgi:putative NADH-flavin reductase